MKKRTLWLPFARRSGWFVLALSLATLAFALAILTPGRQAPASRITMTAGFGRTTRTTVTRALAAELAARGIVADVVETGSTVDELQRVDTGEIDFALVSGAFRISAYAHVREVAPLYLEALHMLVKEEYAKAVNRSFAGLRGLTVNLGPPGSTSAGLAAAVLAFTKIPAASAAGRDGFVARHSDPEEIDALIQQGRRDALPDVVFHLSTMPSKVVLKYVQLARYRLVDLPFADAFRLGAMITEEKPQGEQAEVELPYTSDMIIPPYTYQTEPPVPPEPTHTIGAPLLLVARDAVSPKTVEAVLDAVFDSRFARLHQPPLDRSVLSLPSRIELHPGAIAYRQRDDPLITASDVDTLSSALSVLGALVGSALFLWQWLRQRTQARREHLFENHLTHVAEVEHRVVELELSASMALEPLITLQRDLLRIKSVVLEDFSAGSLGSQSALFDLLTPINSARDHIGKLLLHVRDNLEERAEVEGRASEDIWKEEARRSG